MDQWLLEVTSDLVAKGLAKDLDIAGAGPVHCHAAAPYCFQIGIFVWLHVTERYI